MFFPLKTSSWLKIFSRKKFLVDIVSRGSSTRSQTTIFYILINQVVTKSGAPGMIFFYLLLLFLFRFCLILCGLGLFTLKIFLMLTIKQNLLMLTGIFVTRCNAWFNGAFSVFFSFQLGRMERKLLTYWTEIWFPIRTYGMLI